MLHVLAILAEALAFLLIGGSLLLERSPGCFIALAVCLVLWVPWGLLFRGWPGRVARIGALASICAFTFFSPNVFGASDQGVSVEAVVGLVCVWLICMLCLLDGPIMGLPLGLMCCLSVATIVIPLGRPGGGVELLVAAVLLLVGGAFFYIWSLSHPHAGASRIGRGEFIWRFLPHALLAVVAAAMMVLLADRVKGYVGKIAKYLPESDTGSNSLSLQSRPPRFRDRALAIVETEAGPLPSYLAERFFSRYESGAWVSGQSARTNPHDYGHEPGLKVSAIEGSCAITMQSRDCQPLVPLGAVRQLKEAPATVPASNSRLSQLNDRSVFKWQTHHIAPAVKFQPRPCLELPANLDRLRERSAAVCRGATNDLDRVNRIRNYLSQNMAYDDSAAFKTDGKTDPVLHFLFVGKRGWCVHFASASALMLRSVGIPTRMVTGYLLTDHDPARSEVLDNAGHAWCEALVNTARGPSWIVVDASGAPSSHARLSPRVMKSLVLGLMILTFLFFLFYSRHRHGVADLREEVAVDDSGMPVSDRIVVIYLRLLRFFERLGIYRPRYLTPREFIQRHVPQAQRQDFQVVTEAYERVRYMGYRNLEESLPAVEAAQRRILGLDRPKGLARWWPGRRKG